MSSRNLDQLFGDKLRNHEVQVPEGMWSRIEPEIPVYGKSGNRGLLWFLSAGLKGRTLLLFLLLPFLAGSIWLMNELATEETDNSPMEVHNYTANLGADISPQPSPVNSLVPIAIAEVKEKKEADSQSEEKPLIQAVEIDERNTKTVETRIVKETNIINQNSTTRRSFPKQASTLATPERDEMEKSEIEVAEEEVVFEKRILTNTTEAIPSLMKMNSLDEFVLPTFEIPTDCYSFGSRSMSSIYGDIYGGPVYALRPKTSSAEDVGLYITARDETEKFEYGFSAGIRLSYLINEEIALRTGAHYTQVGELFDYTDPGATDFQFITTYITNSAGDTIGTQFDTVLVTGTLIKQIHNRYHSLDVPILLGYELPLGRLQLSLSLGPVINISSWHRGQILDPTLNPVDITSSEPGSYPAYKTNFGIGVYGGAAILYPLKDGLFLFGEPHFMHRFQPITRPEYSIQQKNTQVGLNIGLRLRLK